MWCYCWPHIAYHTVRVFPKNNRLKIRLTLWILTLVTLAPAGYVLSLDETFRCTPLHLLELLVTSMVLIFFLIGFAFLFTIMDPVPREVKIAFHVYGIVTAVFTVVSAAYTLSESTCQTNSAALYWYSYAAVVWNLLIGVCLVLLAIFWTANRVCQNSVLNVPQREGMCYETVSCCPCVWHI